MINVENRARFLWEEVISDPYKSLIHGLNNHRECLCLISYDSIVSHPVETVRTIYKFLGLEEYAGHHFDAIATGPPEPMDMARGLENLHVVRSQLRKTSADPVELLGTRLADYYNQFNIVT